MKIYFVLIIWLFLTCVLKGQIENGMNLTGSDILEQQTNCVNPVLVYEDSARLPLRKFVLEQMGDLSGKTVIDIGAGPGFFAFEIAKKAKRVIATELDDLFLEYMSQNCQKGNICNFEIREADNEQSELKSLQVDYALMVYVFHYLHDPKVFLNNLKNALTSNGKIFIVNSQISSVIIKDYLMGAGFVDLREEFFQYETANCGKQEIQLITATLP
jgi:ubiquinone/menaquinone biosynthesis C-methylase UbiE